MPFKDSISPALAAFLFSRVEPVRQFRYSALGGTFL